MIFHIILEVDTSDTELKSFESDPEWWADAAAEALKEYGAEVTYRVRT